jgi:ATP-dependent protease Clp ATPase subunit
MYELPSADDIARVEVDAGAVKGEHPPHLLSAKQLAKRAAS